MQLVALVSASFVLAVVLRKRPVALVGFALGFRLLVPNVASVLFTGSSSASQVHPAAYFLLAAFVVTLFTRPRQAGRELSAHLLFYGALVFVFLAAIFSSVLQGQTAVGVLVDTFGFGILLCLMIRVAIDGSPERGRRMAHVFVGLAACQAIIAIAQWSTGRTLLWEEYMASYYWWSPTQTRTSGTVGAWLDLATLLAVAVPLTAAIRRWWLRFSVAILLVIGIILAQGRTALVVATVCLAILTLTSSMNTGARLLSSGALVVAGVYLSSSVLVEGITTRYATDTLSGEARAQAANFALSQLPERVWVGSGFATNGSTRTLGLISSFENSYLMYAWDIGVVFTVVMFLALASPLFVAGRRRLVPGSWLALASALFLIGTFSGFQTPGPTAWVVFTAAGLSVFKGRDRAAAERHIGLARVPRGESLGAFESVSRRSRL